MPTTRKPPGSPKGQAKPRTRILDEKFPERLQEAMDQFTPSPIGVPELASRVKCTRAVLLKYVKGDAKSPDPPLLLKLSDALNVRMAWLLTGAKPMRDELSTQARQIAQNIDAITDPRERERAIATALALTTEPVENERVVRAFKTSDRPKIAGKYSTPTLWDADVDE